MGERAFAFKHPSKINEPRKQKNTALLSMKYCLNLIRDPYNGFMKQSPHNWVGVHPRKIPDQQPVASQKIGTSQGSNRHWTASLCNFGGWLVEVGDPGCD